MSGVNPYLRPAGAITVEEFRASIAATLSGTPLFLDSRTRTVATPLNQPVRLAANASAYQMAVYFSGVSLGAIDGLIGRDSNISLGSNHRVSVPGVSLLYAGEELWFVNLSPLLPSILVSEVVP
jgi:hypothetical protein